MSQTREEKLSFERLQFLVTLPIVLNSSLDPKKIIEIALEHLKIKLEAEAATVFTLTPSGKELLFWAPKGGKEKELEGKKMPADRGIVGWVIERQESALVADAAKDPRFYSEVGESSGFETLALICVPLTARGSKKIGALQVLNKKGRYLFTKNDLFFVEQVAHQLALALHNALLFEELSVQNLKLRELERRKDDVIQVIAHEFNTPLNVIQNSAELMSSGVLNAEVTAELAGTLQNGVNRLTRLVNQIKELYRASEQGFQLHRRSLKVQDIFGQVQALLGKEAEKRHIKIRTEVNPEVETVEADLTHILVALRNLISNAIRFTPDHGIITLTAAPSAGMVEIVVKDTGIGIDSKNIALIFEPFFVAQDVLQHSSGEHGFRSGGLGLGLSTVKAIIEAHGASVDVSSEPGQGTSFRFLLPKGE